MSFLTLFRFRFPQIRRLRCLRNIKAAAFRNNKLFFLFRPNNQTRWFHFKGQKRSLVYLFTQFHLRIHQIFMWIAKFFQIYAKCRTSWHLSRLKILPNFHMDWQFFPNLCTIQNILLDTLVDWNFTNFCKFVHLDTLND